MEISEIKQSLKIETVLKHYNLQADRNHMLKCPFHEEKEPSLKIYTNTNTFNCFGCGKAGDVIEFIQLKEKCNKHEALVKATGLVKSEELIVKSKLTPDTQHLNCPPVNSQSLKSHIEIITKIFTTFKNGLNSSVAKKPKEYLQSRNLNHELLELGYNRGQFHHRGKLEAKEQEACINARLFCF